MSTRYAPTLFETTDGDGTGSWLRGIFSFFRLYLGSIGDAYRAWRDFERLNAMSDAELAELDLTRDRILQHVLDVNETPAD